MQRLLLVVIACAGLAAGCGSDDSDEAAAGDQPAVEEAPREVLSAPEDPSAEDASAARKRRGPLVRLRGSQVGPVLFSGHNRALYLFTRDSKNKTRCYGACAEAWPPFYAKGRPRAGRGVDADLLGTIERRDGRRQVTYGGQPLYFYVDDPRGQVLCNDVAEFGGTWFALNSEGNPPS